MRYRREVLSFLIGMLLMTVGARVMFKEPRVEYVEVEVEVPVYIEAENPIAKMCEYRNPDAEALARLVNGYVGYNLSPKGKKTLMEVVDNRSKCGWGDFGNTIQEVCNKTGQWEGYVADGYYLESDYELALEMLNDKSGARFVPTNCLFLRCEYGKVIVRSEWNSKNEWTVE